ncbi:GntR family transcriptional regulator YhfZ [Fusibacter sp. 3D3]|uniref:GntR family transcriptional regulator YhfZ n=1 Tax=Fusibacter sp. 3D3 TaxID=1048380 RepID=UPI00085611B6|nr:GntR family transcriptional regulator YhfZ [Fusibacter sp. 3D3]GAU75491.1 hypothetical protein YhfZ [Fusibacter sp. 3D3]
MDLSTNRLMSKNGLAIKMLSQELFSYEVGDRIRTITEYVDLLESSRGTVQSAMKFLQDDGCISLESRGHLGTFLVKTNHKKLWEYSDFGVIIGAMPLPYSKRYEGLATGLYKVFENKEIPFSLSFMRGAEKRIQALNFGKYSFAIISKLAAEIHQNENPNLSIVHEFKSESYVGKHVVIFRDPKHKRITNGMRVGFDSVSLDQSKLTEVECKSLKVTYVATPYNQIIQKLEMNEIDAAIWNGDEIFEKKLEVYIQPLKNPVAIEMDKKGNVAVIVVSNETKVIGRIMERLLDLEMVEEVQKKVMNNDMIPIY